MLRAVQKRVNLVDLVKNFLSNGYLLAKIGVDAAENLPLKVCQKAVANKVDHKLANQNIGLGTVCLALPARARPLPGRTHHWLPGRQACTTQVSLRKLHRISLQQF